MRTSINPPCSAVLVHMLFGAVQRGLETTINRGLLLCIFSTPCRKKNPHTSFGDVALDYDNKTLKPGKQTYRELLLLG